MLWSTQLWEIEIPLAAQRLTFKSEIFERLKKEYPNSKNDEEFIQQLRKYNLLDSLPIIAKSDDNIVARIVFHENMIPT